MKIRSFIKLNIMLFLAIVSFTFFNNGFAIDPLTNASALRYATALIKVNITSQNYYSQCVSSGQNGNKGTWGVGYTLCPINSFQSVTPSIDSTAVHNCVCDKNCPPDSHLAYYGNLGLKVYGINCVLPVSLWLPESIFSGSGGGQDITLFGTQVYASNKGGGTQVFIQPSSSRDTFNITVDGGWISNTTTAGSDAAFLSNFITINMFQNMQAQFPGCPNSNGC
ncbi:MAG: hypothetical protein JO131_07545 [Gammaproteobacteria bacterium]|nr:hypothetical protein [Gammaproteobacteria bacterium]